MKRTVLLGILGIAATATAFGQGAIVFNNSQPDATGNYHPVTFAATGAGVSSTDGISLTFWYGAGANLTADQLVQGPSIAGWNTPFEGLGYYGYYNPTTVSLPNWTSGDTYTFQLRATGANVDPAKSVSILWDESANIAFVGGTPPGPPGLSTTRIGLEVFPVPEPASLVLLGLGLGGLMFARRRS